MADSAFISKTDPFGISGTGKPLALASVSDGKAASVAEAKDDKGDVVAYHVYGTNYSPEYEYKVKAAGTVTLPSLGTPVSATLQTGDTVQVIPNSIGISTSAGGETTVSISCDSAPSGAVGCSFVYPEQTIALGVCQHAKTLFSAFTVGGTGAYLQSANYTISCSVGKATVDGEAVAFGVSEGKIEADVEIVQTGSAEPTLTPGTDWVVTAPLACSNPDADYPTWSAALTKYLTASEPSS